MSKTDVEFIFSFLYTLGAPRQIFIFLKALKMPSFKSFRPIVAILGCMACTAIWLKVSEYRAIADQGDFGAVAELRDQLEKGLKARRPEEFQFIGRVVDLVNAGRLPRKMAQETFDYARKKGHPKYPFPYFERVLRLRAKKIGVTI